MSSLTPKLAMELPAGTDVWDRVDHLNNNLTKVDTAIGYTLCTSTTRPAVPFVGQPIYETDTRRRYISIDGTVTGWRPVAGDTFDSLGAGTVRATRPVRIFGLDSNHAAFPSVCARLDGVVILVYRQGTDHSVTRDGVIKSSFSSDHGRSWTTPTTAVTGAAGQDLRDPCVSLSRDGTKVYLSYFKGTVALAAAGVFFRVSTDGGVTWGGEIRVDSLPYAASSAPIIELNNGTLVCPFYGRSGVEVWDSVWISKSTNGGTTWPTQTRIINGTTATDHRQEPYIALLGTTAVMGYRHGTAASIGISVSTDNTVNWSAGAAKFAGTGRPNLFFTNDLTLSCLYRSTGNENGVVRSSKDSGSTWTPERLVDMAPTAVGWMTYSGTDRISRGINLCALSQESSSTVSRVFLTCFGEAGGNSPFGTIPTDAEAAAANLDNLIFGTSFEQTDGQLPSPWTIAAGAISVVNGAVQSAVADATADFVRVYSGVNDMEVEADISNVGGFDSGSAVIARMINATSYLMFTAETNGVNFRLYKVVSGTPTQLATVAGQLAFGAYHTYKIVARGQEIRCFINGASMLYHLLSGGDQTTFATGFYGGIKLNSQGTTVHKCRRFTIRG